MNIRAGIDGSSNMYHEDIMPWIKNCSYKLFFSNQLHLLAGEKNLNDSIQLLSELRLMKLILILLKVRKNILKTTCILMSANRKIFPKKRDFPFLFSTKKEVITIPKIWNLLPSIFWALTSVLRVQKPSFSIKLGCIVLTSPLKLTRISIEYWLNFVWY